MNSNSWVTDPAAYLEPKIGRVGYASEEPKTVVDVFKATVAKHGTRNAMFMKKHVKVTPSFMKPNEKSLYYCVTYIITISVFISFRVGRGTSWLQCCLDMAGVL